MGSAWETLRETVASLSEAEATKALDYIRRLRGEQPDRGLRDLLAGDPAIHVPSTPFARLPAVEPVRGAGIPASELLVRDRR
jgi:hypothetical protein